MKLDKQRVKRLIKFLWRRRQGDVWYRIDCPSAAYCRSCGVPWVVSSDRRVESSWTHGDCGQRSGSLLLTFHPAYSGVDLDLVARALAHSFKNDDHTAYLLDRIYDTGQEIDAECRQFVARRYRELNRAAFPRTLVVCHSPADQEVVGELLAAGDAPGRVVGAGAARLEPQVLGEGEALTKALSGRIEEIDAVLAIVSRSSTVSWARDELPRVMAGEVSQRRLVVVPVAVDDGRLPKSLAGEVLFYRGPERDAREILTRALEAVEAHAERCLGLSPETLSPEVQDRERPQPATRGRHRPMTIEVCVQCSFFQRRFCWQLSSLLQQAGEVPEIVVNTAYLDGADGQPSTADVLSFFEGLGLKVRRTVYSDPEEFCKRGNTRHRQLQESTADWVLFADCDVVFPPRWFAEARQLLAGCDSSQMLYTGRYSTPLAETERLVDALDYPGCVEGAYAAAAELEQIPEPNFGAGFCQIVNVRRMEEQFGRSYVGPEENLDYSWSDSYAKAESDKQFRRKVGKRKVSLPWLIHLQHVRDREVGYHLTAQR